MAAPALPQSAVATPPPSGGLFGTTPSHGHGGDRLNVMVDLNEALDSDLPLDVTSHVAPADPQFGGLSSTLTASAEYVRYRRSVQLIAHASTFVRYSGQLNEIAAVSQDLGLEAAFRLPKQSSLHIVQTAAYTPSYLYQLFPTAALPGPAESIPATPDYRINATPSYSSATKMALTLGSERETHVTTTAEYSRTDFLHQTAALPDLTTFAGGVTVARPVSRNSVLFAGYQYRTGTVEFSGQTKEHRVTIGVEYVRPLSATRRAVFRFDLAPATLEGPLYDLNAVGTTTGSSAAQGSAPALATAPASSVVEERVYHLEGEAGVDYAFRRNWQVRGNYRRGVEYLAGLIEPVFADTLRLELTGLITRRVDVSASAGYSTGASGIYHNTQNMNTSADRIRIRYALKRSFAFYSDYLYYYYDLRGQARIAPALPSVFKQQGIRIGFMLFVEPLRR
jgi:hypothetical protein